ncbi:hypothetical protein niasHS_001956 [Heterodera schachtii]|uniref:Uncharacterized protein n=1 Tax=Heterodera schachtii TaxID=97005 RepID=A0ABD2KBJ3_HETSC
MNEIQRRNRRRHNNHRNNNNNNQHFAGGGGGAAALAIPPPPPPGGRQQPMRQLRNVPAVNNEEEEEQNNQQQQTLLCTCVQAAKCADDGFKQVENGCKLECAHGLDAYAQTPAEGKQRDAHPLTNCFGRNVKMEAMPMNECMQRVDNYCTSSATARISAPAPDYAGWMEPAIASNDTTFEQRQKSAFLRKTSAAFFAFRNFQKCLNNCAKKRSIQCFGAEGCAISLPSDRALAKLFYNQCTQQQNVPKNARDACYCMSTKHRVRDFVGVCPLFINRQLMQMS